MSFNFMATVTICSDFGAPKNKFSHNGNSDSDSDSNITQVPETVTRSRYALLITNHNIKKPLKKLN